MTDSLLPPNATALERALVLSCAGAVDLPTPLRETWSPENCPERLLPWLAWAFGVEDWDATWTANQKRAVIGASIATKRIRGTIGAVRSALGALIDDSSVQEWFNQIPAGDPYTFRILLKAEQQGVSRFAIGSIAAVIERSKNLRSHLDRIELTAKTTATACAGIVSSIGSEVGLDNYRRPASVISSTTVIV